LWNFNFYFHTILNILFCTNFYSYKVDYGHWQYLYWATLCCQINKIGAHSTTKWTQIRLCKCTCETCPMVCTLDMEILCGRTIICLVVECEIKNSLVTWVAEYLLVNTSSIAAWPQFNGETCSFVWVILRLKFYRWWFLTGISPFKYFSIWPVTSGQLLVVSSY
jgi:hypothetical protein